MCHRLTRTWRSGGASALVVTRAPVRPHGDRCRPRLRPLPVVGAAPSHRPLRGRLSAGSWPSAGRVLRQHVLRGSAAGGGGRGGAAGLPPSLDRLGRLILHRTLPQAGKQWTAIGKFHDERGLKSRPPGETRVVSLPPHLVTMWREHVATFGTADDGRLFFTEQGRIITYTTYNRVWHETRALALPPRSPAPRSRNARTTCGTRRCPPGCARARTRPRSPSGPVTASRSCCPGTRSACMTGSPSTISASKGS